MRVLFIIAVLVLAFLLGACGGRSYIDLREPVYFVAEDSFFVGCDKDPAGEAVCRASRRQKIKDGVAQWLDYFEDDARPPVDIVEDGGSVPYGSVNAPIRLGVKKGGCDEMSAKNKSFLACYNYGSFLSYPSITFTAAMPENIAYYVVAHEFGHALGLDHYDSANGAPAIMSEAVPIGGSVLPADIDKLCQIHKECPKRKPAKKGDKDKK